MNPHEEIIAQLQKFDAAFIEMKAKNPEKYAELTAEFANKLKEIDAELAALESETQ